jgi:hypothetical protein
LSYGGLLPNKRQEAGLEYKRAHNIIGGVDDALRMLVLG